MLVFASEITLHLMLNPRRDALVEGLELSEFCWPHPSSQGHNQSCSWHRWDFIIPVPPGSSICLMVSEGSINPCWNLVNHWESLVPGLAEPRQTRGRSTRKMR